ncbi:hypothetical protein O3M35_000497 [Rhynocoris fuscipes]|uniref:F-box domain-containing protein n=1 Tax=Rhynocoris fuscipes TaxID=488301 RepID=A0AAW1DPQ2_9HEMI
MDYARRNAIVFRCILSSMDIYGVMKISSVCREWYEQINSDNLLWKRLCAEEGIPPEEWDWQDNEQWLMGPPCKWKQCYINYQRTAFNFNKKQYKPYKYRVHGLNVDYDGQTLLFEAFDGLNICHINKNNIEFKQRLKFANKIAIAKTNTDFIVILQNEGLHFCIFHRLNDKYIFYYKIYLNKDEIKFDLNIDKVSLNLSALSPYLFSNVTRCDRGDEQP